MSSLLGYVCSMYVCKYLIPNVLWLTFCSVSQTMQLGEVWILYVAQHTKETTSKGMRYTGDEWWWWRGNLCIFPWQHNTNHFRRRPRLPSTQFSWKRHYFKNCRFDGLRLASPRVPILTCKWSTPGTGTGSSTGLKSQKIAITFHRRIFKKSV